MKKAFAILISISFCLFAGEKKASLNDIIEKVPSQVTVWRKDPSKLLESIRDADDFELARLADAVMEAERKEEGGNASYTVSLKLLDAMQVLSEKRPAVAGTVLRCRGEILRRQGRTEEAAKFLNEGMAALAKVRFQMEYELMKAAHGRGTAMLALGDKKEADAMFVEVTRYAWHLTPDDATAEKQKEIYIDAIRQLIQLRKGDKEKLASIRISPGMKPLFRSELEAAQKSAK